jgi:threonine-phosphate decarboxylase
MSQSELYPLHGGQLGQIAERFNIPRTQLLDFSANINPDGPPTSVLETIRESLGDLSILTDYPDLEETELKQSIAHYAEVRPQNIVVANGFVPLLDAALRTLRIRRCVLPVPAFVEYRKTLERAEIGMSLYALDAESCFNYDPATMLAGEHDAILLANPQNPSGVCHDTGRMREIIALASKKNMYVLLDEAFIDYVPEHSLTTATDEFANLIVFRSATKFHGMPGLRAAYAATNPALSSQIEKRLPPWPITTLASRAVSAALADRSYVARARTANGERRIALQRDLEALGLVVYPSGANFLLFRLSSGIDPNAFWQHMIVQHRVVLRSCANYDALADGHFRVAVRTNEENRYLVGALAESLSRFGTGQCNRAHAAHIGIEPGPML